MSWIRFVLALDGRMWTGTAAVWGLPLAMAAATRFRLRVRRILARMRQRPFSKSPDLPDMVN